MSRTVVVVAEFTEDELLDMICECVMWPEPNRPFEMCRRCMLVDLAGLGDL